MELSGDPQARLGELRVRLEDTRRFLDIDSKETELKELRAQAAEPGLWNDPNAAREITGKLARYERILEQQAGLARSLEDAEVFLQLALEESDPSIATEVLTDLSRVSAELAILERESLFFGEYDELAALVSVHAGAGGVDAQDWAEMLLRMYLRHFERSGHNVTLEDVTPGDEAGIKSASFTVAGITHMELWRVNEVSIVWCALVHSIRLPDATHHLRRLTSSRRWRTIQTSRFETRTFVSTRIRPRARADNTSTRPIPRFGSRTSQQASWPVVRLSGARFRTEPVR